MRTPTTRLATVLAIFLAGALFPNAAQAQLQKVQQTVFGMDCAPCAHAMERGLGSMKGVESVSVSLNDGIASIDLTEGNTTTYRKLREAVANGGFSARKATLTVQGTVRQTGDQWILKTPAGEQFVLKANEEASSTRGSLEGFEADQQVTLTGQVSVSEPKEGRWPVQVQNIRSAG